MVLDRCSSSLSYLAKVPKPSHELLRSARLLVRIIGRAPSRNTPSLDKTRLPGQPRTHRMELGPASAKHSSLPTANSRNWACDRWNTYQPNATSHRQLRVSAFPQHKGPTAPTASSKDELQHGSLNRHSGRDDYAIVGIWIRPRRPTLFRAGLARHIPTNSHLLCALCHGSCRKLHH